MPMDRDDIDRRGAPRYDADAVHAQLRRTAEELDDRPVAGAERAAREMLEKLDTLQAELDRLLRGLEATAARLSASQPRPDGEAGPGR
jgi:hypothetical protein